MQTQHPWEVVVVRHGTRDTRRSEVFLNYPFYGEPDGPFTLDYFFWVLRRGDEAIVVDTGYSAAGAASRGREVLIDPLEALRRLGVEPASGVPVVVTHAHYDHIGNLPAFGASPVHIAQSEMDFWTSDIATRALFSHFGDPDEVEELRRVQAEGRLRPFSERAPIADGVELVEVGGHTPGQSMAIVETTAGRVLIASDAAHFVEELERDMPFVSMVDVPQSYRVLDEIRRMDVAHVLTGHDAGTLDRLEPLGDQLPGLAAVIGRLR
ncbi:N-acyl homoserine lactonase family protein [Agrococcus jenensis]|uniref:Glyoxylase-like metal-dependent hydrolase (Beta-lactamase superfamily II) n=1 Tax=Agrococcus jenensis TaxID=46353 RepID=A0A3N2APS9_9MICO|nr:N-acyl homoserine lactonase family protein [Agrococcus jenensis]ROR64986.1 glyoxylase-like metal-dependent hydrolase (beta-lactamase superfamily II) [Agrococcus jenensis]